MKQINIRISKAIAAKLQFGRTKVAELRQEEGVTLIELLAVVVILGIVAIIAIPTVTNAVSKSKLNSTMTTEATIQTALERYVADHGQYPTTLAQLSEQTFGDGNAYSAAAAYNSSTQTGNSSGGPYGPYLTTSFPQNDGWGNPFYYGPLASDKNAIYPLTVGATSPQVTGYVLLSGDGTQITFPSTTPGPQSSNGFVYAAGGTDAANVSIGYSPTAGTPSTGSELNKDIYVKNTGANTGTYVNLPTFTNNN